jgi:hypothetical protein
MLLSLSAASAGGESRDLACRSIQLLGELPDLRRDDGEPFALFPGASRLDRGVDRQDIRLAS